MAVSQPRPGCQLSCPLPAAALRFSMSLEQPQGCRAEGGCPSPALAGTALLNPVCALGTQNPAAVTPKASPQHQICFFIIGDPSASSADPGLCLVPPPCNHHPFSPVAALHLAERQICLKTHFPQFHKPAWTLQLVTLTTGTAQSLPHTLPRAALQLQSSLSKLMLSLWISRVNKGQARR